jgi:hypothetical protein
LLLTPLASPCDTECRGVFGSPCDARFRRRWRTPSAAVRLRCRRVRSGAVALGERTCLGAVWGGEHEGVLGFIGGAAGGEKPLAGVPPLLRVYDGRGPLVSAGSPSPLFWFWAEVGQPQ